MRVLFTTQPADGHLNPMLGLSGALRAAGHDVLFATSAPFVGRIQARGERAVAVGLDWLESEGPVEPPDPQTDPTGELTVFTRLFLREVGRRMASDLLSVVEDFRPDVVVRESVEFAGSAVAERVGVPLATFDFAFPIDITSLTAGYGDQVGDELRTLREHVGLGAAARPDWFRGDLQICTLPSSYLGTAHAPSQVVIQPNALRVVDDAAVPDWVTGLEDAVYVSLGTVFPRWFPEVLEAAATGAAAVGATTVITCGPSVELDRLRLPDGPHVRVATYVPQGAVLDRCVAAVTHGGTGTALGALARGIPVVVIPLGADQFAHAAAVRRLHVGIVLDAPPVTPQLVTDALQELLEDPTFRRNAAALAAEFAALPGPQQAVTALERLVASRREVG